MFLIIGSIIVVGSVLGGYVALGGHLIVLWQPFELVIIGGSGIGAFVIANNKQVLGGTLGAIGSVLKGPKYKRADYMELISLQYQVFKLAKSKGMLAMESHVENPSESSLFQEFPSFAADHHAVDFFCDYLRLMTMGTDNPHEMEGLIDQELEIHHEKDHEIQHALVALSEGFPALGIVAAVLGVIHTMGSITEPPEILGHLIGGALVGTFLGVLLCYGFVGPMAAALKGVQDADAKYLQCMKAGILAYLQGYAPAVCVEFSRKTLQAHVRPSFQEVEETTASLAPPS